MDKLYPQQKYTSTCNWDVSDHLGVITRDSTCYFYEKTRTSLQSTSFKWFQIPYMRTVHHGSENSKTQSLKNCSADSRNMSQSYQFLLNLHFV